MKANPMPSLARLRECFECDAENGILRWRVRPDVHASANTKFAGKQAGSVGGDGYWAVTIDRKAYLVHRIIWKMFHEVEPESGMDIDHRDLNKANNRIDNLRKATKLQNQVNKKSRTDRPKGTVLMNGAIGAKIKLRNGKQKWLGTFPDYEQASQAYQTAARAEYGEFMRA